MAIQPVQPNTNKGQRSYLAAAGLGMLGGYAVKHLLPASKDEIDKYVSQTVINNRKKLSSKEIANLAKSARPTFDFVIVAGLALTALAFFRNMYNKLADKS